MRKREICGKAKKNATERPLPHLFSCALVSARYNQLRVCYGLRPSEGEERVASCPSRASLAFHTHLALASAHLINPKERTMAALHTTELIAEQRAH